MTGWQLGLEGWLLMAAWGAVMVLLVVLLVREPRHTLRQDAATILRARFARGELSEEEYLHAASLLDDDPEPTATAAGRPARRPHSGQEAPDD